MKQQSFAVTPAYTFLSSSEGSYRDDVYDIAAKKWKSFSRLYKPKYGATVAVISSSLFFVGGYLNSDFTKDFAEIQLRAWKKIVRPDLLIKRNRSGVGHYACKYVIIVGGWQMRDLKNCEAFSLLQNKWSCLPSLSLGRYGAIALSINENIYAIGGYPQDRGGEPGNIFEVLNFVDWGDGWKKVELHYSWEGAHSPLGVSIGLDAMLIFGGREYGDHPVLLIKRSCEAEGDIEGCHNHTMHKQNITISASSSYCMNTAVIYSGSVYAIIKVLSQITVSAAWVKKQRNIK